MGCGFQRFVGAAFVESLKQIQTSNPVEIVVHHVSTFWELLYLEVLFIQCKIV